MRTKEQQAAIDETLKSLTSFKQRDLGEGKCMVCKNPLTSANNPITFYRIEVEQFIWDPNSVRRAVGLELQIGALASIMGPDEDLAKGTGKTTKLVCSDHLGAIAPFWGED